MLILPDGSVVLLQQPKVANHTFLSAKLDQLIHECVARSTYTDIARKVERYTSAKTSSCQTILKKGRRLTEQTLDSCQLKRIKSLEVQVRNFLACVKVVCLPGGRCTEDEQMSTCISRHMRCFGYAASCVILLAGGAEASGQPPNAVEDAGTGLFLPGPCSDDAVCQAQVRYYHG